MLVGILCSGYLDLWSELLFLVFSGKSELNDKISRSMGQLSSFFFRRRGVGNIHQTGNMLMTGRKNSKSLKFKCYIRADIKGSVLKVFN